MVNIFRVFTEIFGEGKGPRQSFAILVSPLAWRLLGETAPDLSQIPRFQQIPPDLTRI
jgi:hypothetical protein